MRILLVVLICFTFSWQANGQGRSVSAAEWAKKLGDPSDHTNQASRSLDSMLEVTDSIRFYKLLQQILAAGDSNNLYFQARVYRLRSVALYIYSQPGHVPIDKKVVKGWMDRAMHAAYETDDEFLIAYIAQLYYGMMIFFGDTELAMMYGIYSTELYEKNFGVCPYPPYNYLGEMMYRVREYDKCIEYCRKWLDLGPVPGRVEFEHTKMTTFNTIALAYHRTGRYDSAMYYYHNALKMAAKLNRQDWEGIVSGNMGQVQYLLKRYDTARALLEMDYRISMGYKYYDNAANSLQWAARANLALGNQPRALKQVREAMELIRRSPDSVYLRNIYYAAMEIFGKSGRYDSALYYSALYQQQHDAIEKKINLSSAAVSKVRMNEERNLYNIRKLQFEKQAQERQRNFVILGILLLSVISVLVLNGQRRKLAYRKLFATQQMEMFTQNIIEKNSLIDHLEKQMNGASQSQQEIISTLSHLTILTESHWDTFKSLFEKIHPLFFQRLKSKSPDITLAEQRMAALTRLQLSTRQMASMLGISPDSVHKTRQRLRTRLSVTADTNLEEYLGNL